VATGGEGIGPESFCQGREFFYLLTTAVTSVPVG
jgi:hypothetical protein